MINDKNNFNQKRRIPMKKVAACLIVVMCFVVSLGGMVYAAEKPAEKPSVKAPLTKSSVSPTTADIRVAGTVVECMCKKVCDQLDALALKKNLRIGLTNQGPKKMVQVTIKVTVFNLLSNSEMTYTEIKEFDSADEHTMTTMGATQDTPLVIKKSYGIKIEVFPSPSTGVTDPNPSNNKKTVTQCDAYAP